MINFKSTIFTSIVFLSLSLDTSAQKESVILYNSQPVKVELSKDGKINSFIGKAPGYMKGFELIPSYSPKPIKSAEIAEIPAKEIEGNAGYTIVTNEKVELNYKPNFATLDKSLINQLDKVAARLKKNSKLKIYLTAQSSNTASILNKNRLNSAATYLSIKGVDKSRVQTEILKSDKSQNTLVINYIY